MVSIKNAAKVSSEQHVRATSGLGVFLRCDFGDRKDILKDRNYILSKYRDGHKARFQCISVVVIL